MPTATQVIERALAAGVERMMAIGTGDGRPISKSAIRLAERYPFIYATIGVHPHDAAKATPETFDRLRDLAAHPKVLAHRRDRPRLPLRFLAARRAARRVRAPAGNRRRAPQAHRDPHARSLGRHAGAACASTAGRRHHALLHRRRRASARRRWTSAFI